ncbi:MAG: WD40 repeat domain-containing protein, partial [Candidatus Thiosymbion ectosymbiont of Robbea hypermnestra]|nr:WD40 repeat domain-containing protein [Candidatus Thiosymbion ectosymbiont of Robbea hypermnestra]
FTPFGQLRRPPRPPHTLRLWDPATGQPIHTLAGHEHWVTAVAFSPDGQLLASASLDNTLRLWDPASGKSIRTLSGHESGVRTVAFSPDGQQLASASDDRTLRLWNPATGQPIRTLSGHEGWVRDVTFSPDGRWLASASSDHTLRLWDVRGPTLLLNGPAPSPRAALLSEALQRLWRLRIDGFDISPDTWTRLWPRDGYSVDQEFSIDIRPAAATADPAGQPIPRAFDIRPLLDPPPPGQDKLDQLLHWLAQQEPRLQP